MPRVAVFPKNATSVGMSDFRAHLETWPVKNSQPTPKHSKGDSLDVAQKKCAWKK